MKLHISIQKFDSVVDTAVISRSWQDMHHICNVPVVSSMILLNSVKMQIRMVITKVGRTFQTSICRLIVAVDNPTDFTFFRCSVPFPCASANSIRRSSLYFIPIDIIVLEFFLLFLQSVYEAHRNFYLKIANIIMPSSLIQMWIWLFPVAGRQ